MEKPGLFDPLKVGFLVVALAYFLFTFHAMFTLSWIGEWESFGEPFKFEILVEDISANVGVAFRLFASVLALAGVVAYFKAKVVSSRVRRLFRFALVGEAVFWLGLLVSGVLPLISTLGFATWRVNGHVSTLPVLTELLTNEIPILLESILIPLVLFKLSVELSPKKTAKGAIKWGLIAGSVYVFVFWLTGTSFWVTTVIRQGVTYLTSYPENLFSFVITTLGMLGLAVYTAYFAKNSVGTDRLEKLNFKRIGVIVSILGLFYLWNYLTWILFGNDEIWSNWYGWFLGNNLNLWLLSVWMVGLPLLFRRKVSG